MRFMMKVAVFLLIFHYVRFSSAIPYGGMLTLIKAKIISDIDKDAFEKDCALDLKSVVLEASNFQLWALKMLDASGKPTPGLLNGNLHLFGDYEECLSIKEQVDGRIIEGQYCTVSVKMDDETLAGLNFPMSTKNIHKTPEKVKDYKFLGKLVALRLGICVPRSCTVQNLRNVTNGMSQRSILSMSVDWREALCIYKEKPLNYNRFDYFIYLFLLFLLVVIVGSTVYDLYFCHPDSSSSFFLIFSLQTNVQQLSPQKLAKERTLSCLDGIRAISCFWIVLGHTALGGTFLSKNPLYVVQEWNRQLMSTFMWTSFYAVDTFFTISGLLLCYIYFKHSEKRSIGLISFYLNRYLRLTPTLVAVMCVQISLLKFVLTGPYGPFAAELLAQRCDDTWWKVFFFFISFPKCIPQTWYLTTDTHLYMCAPFILFFMKTYPTKIMTGGVVAFFASIIYCFVITVDHRIGSTVFSWSSNLDYRIMKFAFARASSWLLGMYCGYLIYHQNIKLSKRINLIFWTICLFVMVNLILDQVSLSANPYNVYRSAFWNSLARPVWSLCICFITYSCATGNGGFINIFLSWSIFKPLSKLTYVIYVIHHYVVALVLLSVNQSSLHFSNFQILSIYVTVLLIAITFAVPIYLAFEAPTESWRARMEERTRKGHANLI